MGRAPHPATSNPRRWRALRQVILKRDSYRCRACGRAGRLEVDHIIPVMQGGEWWDAAGLQTLCRACHFDKSRADISGPDPERDLWKKCLQKFVFSK